ncbi:hypothetical protein IY145_04180 [Methylosinus sp. H3A]|uniref:hypothetical protein n=1 Tax=Methylosinus sp. H3A TaxID=2785786 RepID=UPI0018C32AD2|nr:hypothetical protein [Methylosinus sp. H3A]MBG0808567.1 hypothetical protein [Methylosinus sp. H3A]
MSYITTIGHISYGNSFGQYWSSGATHIKTIGGSLGGAEVGNAVYGFSSESGVDYIILQETDLCGNTVGGAAIGGSPANTAIPAGSNLCYP